MQPEPVSAEPLRHQRRLHRHGPEGGVQVPTQLCRWPVQWVSPGALLHQPMRSQCWLHRVRKVRAGIMWSGEKLCDVMFSATLFASVVPTTLETRTPTATLTRAPATRVARAPSARTTGGRLSVSVRRNTLVTPTWAADSTLARETRVDPMLNVARAGQEPCANASEDTLAALTGETQVASSENLYYCQDPTQLPTPSPF